MLSSTAYEYNFEIETILHQFTAVVDNAIVMRYDVNKETKERLLKEVIKPSYVFGTKQRVIYDVLNKAHNYTLPIIAINLEGITMVKERQRAKFENLLSNSSDVIAAYMMPTPIEIKLNMTVIAKYMTDLYQIYGKIASQFRTYVPFSWYVPSNIKGDYTELRNKIEWDGNVSFDVRTEAKATDEDKFTAKLGFTVQGWIFPQMTSCVEGIIYDIGTTVVPSEDTLDRIYDDISIFRPLVDSVMQSDKWKKYNNPREIATTHPMISSASYTQRYNNNDVFFIIDKARSKSFTLSKAAKITINGYNLKDCKFLLIPQEGKFHPELEYISKKYTDSLHPFPDSLVEKDSQVSGYILNTVNQTNNSATITFDNVEKLEGEYDIAIFNEIDYDILSKRKGFKLNA